MDPFVPSLSCFMGSPALLQGGGIVAKIPQAQVGGAQVGGAQVGGAHGHCFSLKKCSEATPRLHWEAKGLQLYSASLFKQCLADCSQEH